MSIFLRKSAHFFYFFSTFVKKIQISFTEEWTLGSFNMIFRTITTPCFVSVVRVTNDREAHPLKDSLL